MAKLGSNIVVASIVLGGAVGCKHPAPPFETFEVKVDAPPPKGKPASAPPEGALQPWRIWVNQEQPRQKKTPVWVSYAAKDARLLEIAEDGHWRCLVNPVRLDGKVDEDSSVERWVASRAVRCSSDGWRTHVEALVQVEFAADGKETRTEPPTPLYLNDIVQGQPRRTVVVLEAPGSKRGHSG